MRFQDAPGTCGAAAVVNACRAFSIRVPERSVRKLAGTDGDGTDQQGIIFALRSLGLSAEEYRGTRRSPSWQWLHGALLHGRVIILCMDNWQHWTTAIGSLGDRVILIDSTNTKANRAENGVHVLSRDRLLRRWGCPGGDHRYYGIGVSKN